MHRPVIAALCVMLLSPVTSHAQSRSDQLLDAVEVVEEMLEVLPQEWVSIEGIVRATGGEATDLIDWVTQNIAYRPYGGTMRGAEGTLITGAGNALDQSLLLASALKAAGYEAQIVEAQTDDTGVDALLARALEQPVALDAPDSGLAQQLEALGNDLAEALNKDTPARQEQPVDLNIIRQEAKTVAKRIGTSLAQAGESLTPEAAVKDLRAAIAQYHFVRWRLQPSDPWQAAHPALGTAPGALSEAGRVFVDAIPDDLLHRIEIRAVVAVTSLAGTDEKTVGVISVPIANHLTRSLNYQAYPAGMADAAEYLSDAGAAKTRFMPSLNGQQMRKAKLFNLSGLVIDPIALTSPAAGLFESLGNTTNDAGSVLAAEGDARQIEQTSLSGHWLEITQTGPGTELVTARRILWSQQDTQTDARGRFYDLTQSYRISWAAGPLTEVAQAHIALERMRLALTLLEDGRMSEFDVETSVRKDLEMVSLQTVQHRPDLGTEIRLRPSVTAVAARLGPDTQRLVSDLMLDSRFVLDDQGVDVPATTELGVWASLTETLLLRGVAQAADMEMDAISSAAARLAGMDDWGVGRDDTAIRIGALGGDTFVVDPATGLAIARDAQGVGQGQLTEENMMLLNIGMVFYKGIVGASKCRGGPPEKYSSCMACVQTGALLGIGAMAMGTQFIATYVITASDMVREVAC